MGVLIFATPNCGPVHNPAAGWAQAADTGGTGSLEHADARPRRVANFRDRSSQRARGHMAEPTAEPQQCRICLESDGELVAPCDCKGTARFAHAACIAEWQSSQQERRGSAHRCARCDICGVKYRGLPDPPPRPIVAVCREHVADYIVTLKSVLSSSLLVWILLFSCSIYISRELYSQQGGWTAEKWMVSAHEFLRLTLIIAAPWSVGLHIFLVRNNLRLVQTAVGGVRVIRHGPPVDGLDPGSLLVFLDNRSVDSTGPFDHTVLYLLEHDNERGSIAIVLNQPMLGSDSQRQSEQQATADPVPRSDGSLHVELRNGGPVCKEVWHALHTMGASSLPGSRRIFPPHSGVASVATAPADANAPIYIAECVSPHCLYDLPDVVVRTAAADGSMVALISGTAQWGPGQLAGEVRNGSWGWVEPRFQKRQWFAATALSRNVEDLGPAEVESGRSAQYQLWEELAESPFIEVCLPGVQR